MVTVKMPKRCHKTLDIDQKLQILGEIGKKLYTVLCEEYGVMPIDLLKNVNRNIIHEYKRKMTEMGLKRPVKMIHAFFVPFFVI